MRVAAPACLVMFVAAPALAQTPPPPPPPAIFAFSGEGHASAAPDMALISTGVLTEADTARKALDANTEAMTKLLASLKAEGIEERDITTSGFSVQPRYVYPQRQDGTPGVPRITGYQVRNNVGVKVRDLSKLGGLLDRAVTQGSNQIDGLTFDIDDKKALLEAARKDAFADARAKADLYAQAAGVTLGRLVSLSEQTGSLPPPMPQMLRMETKAAASDVPISRGEQEIAVSVNATWEIKP